MTSLSTDKAARHWGGRLTTARLKGLGGMCLGGVRCEFGCEFVEGATERRFDGCWQRHHATDVRHHFLLLLGQFVSLIVAWGIEFSIFRLVFASSVLWTEKIHRTKLNWTVVWSIFQLWLPKFGVIPVASCLISNIIQNCSKTGWNRLQLVKRSCVLHSLVMTFITFNLIFGSSKNS